MTLANQDLNQIRIIVHEEVEEQLSIQLKENLKLLPTRKEFLDVMSELMGEVKDERDENVILDGQISDHEKRITKLEDIHPHGQHQAA